MITVEVYVTKPENRLLTFECELSPNGHTVPRFTRRNVAQLIYWLWQFDPEAGPERGGTTVPYLLDDAVLLLQGGVFAIQYPTDHGKSTLVDIDSVVSCLLWPERTLNIHIKRAVETAVASVQACAFKLNRASEFFPYARPLCRWDVQTGLPQVKGGFFIEGCELRELGERDRSVYPAGIGSLSVQGMRGRAKIDDVEDENTLKSEAKSDTIRKQVNNSIRNLQKTKPGQVPLWAIFGTPQGANSVMYVVDADLASSKLQFHVIRRPAIIQDGPFKGQRLFPDTEIKAEMQKELMDPAAYNIAYHLRVPGEGRFDHKLALEYVLDPELPLMRDQNSIKEYLYERLQRDGMKHVGFQYSDSGHLAREAHRMIEEDLALYIGWDPATVGTSALGLMAMLPQTRWVLRVHLSTDGPDEQAKKVLEWQQLFPDVTVVVERDGQQDAFIDLLRIMDPATMIVPHTTHGFNKNTRHSGVPAMMNEMQTPGRWHLPYTPEDYCADYLSRVIMEIRRWGPSAHPHALMAFWFPWYYDKSSRMEPDQPKQKPGEDQVEVYDVVLSGRRPLQDIPPRVQQPQSPSEESWNRRWPSLRRA